MLQKYTDKISTAAIRQYVLVISPANPFLKFERVSGGVSPQEDLHSDEPGVGWEATGGLDIPGCHRVRRGDVCVELLGAHGCRPAAEGHQRRGLQSGFGGSLSGDVSQRPQEGERLSCRLTSFVIALSLSSFFMSAPCLQGYMWKKGHVRRNWTERWFVLKPSTMAYYVSEDLKDKRGEIKLDKSCIIEVGGVNTACLFCGARCVQTQPFYSTYTL